MCKASFCVDRFCQREKYFFRCCNSRNSLSTCRNLTLKNFEKLTGFVFFAVLYDLSNIVNIPENTHIQRYLVTETNTRNSRVPKAMIAVSRHRYRNYYIPVFLTILYKVTAMK